MASRSILFFLFLFISLVKSDESSSADDHWPVTDENGYYLPYASNGRWINWWTRNKPGLFRVLSRFWQASDNSNVPSDEAELDRVLPIYRPYWLNTTTSEPQQVGRPGLRATWIGHATVLVEVDSTLVLADPIFSTRASPVQWAGRKRFRPAACSVAELPEELKAVLISHSHYDHLDYNSVQDLHLRYGSKLDWYVPQGLGTWLESNFEIARSNIHEMIWWDELTIPGTNVKIAMTPANHWCRRTLFDGNQVLWGSFAVIGQEHRFWFGGDTAYADVFKQIGQKYGPFDLAAIPIGAYEPRALASYVHVSPEEAIEVHKDIQSRKSFGIHWGTFKMTYEFYLEPRQKIESNTELPKDQFVTLNIGQLIEV